MQDFEFMSPTKIFFGEDYINKVGEILADDKVKNVLIVYGMHQVEKSGLLTKITAELEFNGIHCFTLHGIRVNPLREKVYEGIKIARENDIDFVLAIGGGSVIDTAKAVGAGTLYDGDFYDFNMHKVTPTKSIPVGVILTIAAAGSELSNSCVISDDKLNKKAGFNCDSNRPKYAFMNPNFLKTLSEHQMATGIVDMNMHTMERYFYESKDNDLCDNFALVVIKNIYQNAYKWIKNHEDYNALSNLMITSSLAHNGLTSLGKNPILAIHKLEHNVGGYYPKLVHADGLGILLIPWLKYYKKYLGDKIYKLGKYCFEIEGTNKEEVIDKTIDTYAKLLDDLKMPRHFKDLNISFDPEEFANYFTNNGTTSLKYEGHDLDKEAVIEVYKNSL